MSKIAISDQKNKTERDDNQDKWNEIVLENNNI
jgi:hypothetical protein